MGVVGYGDIGQAAARIARAFGMKIIALRRNPQLSEQEMQEHLTVSSALACSASICPFTPRQCKLGICLAACMQVPIPNTLADPTNLEAHKCITHCMIGTPCMPPGATEMHG